MLSKEEIEKDKQHLRDLSEDALKCEDDELIGIDAYAVGSITRILQYIEQLETKEQKLIEKLERDIAENPDAKYTKWYLADCLKIVKGEKQ